MKHEIIGLGNPLIDIIMSVDDTFINQLGLDKGSMNLVDVERQEEIIELGKDITKKIALGGSAANTMVMISQLGGKVAYGGKVGYDQLANDFESQLVNLGIHSCVKRQEGATGSTVILVTPDAERTMNTHLGMCLNYSENDLDKEVIKNSEYLYLEGYLLDTTTQKKTIVSAVEQAKSSNVKIALSLSDSFCVERSKSEFQHLLENYVDILFCNNSEAELMTGFSDSKSQLESLSENVDHVILTRGKKGSKISFKGAITDIPCFEVTAIDTTGAGDSFAAGYLYGMTQSYSVKQAGMLAAYCASIVVCQNSPRYDGDFRAVVKDYLI